MKTMLRALLLSGVITVGLPPSARAEPPALTNGVAIPEIVSGHATAATDVAGFAGQRIGGR
jgi:hypothetical protein